MMPVSFSELHTTMLFHSNNTNNNNQRTNTSTTLVPPPPPPPPEHHCSDYNDSSISTASDISQAQDDYLKINTPGSNYDISYYFDPSASSATTAYQKSDSEEEEEDNNINENISINRSNTSLPYRSRSLSIGSTVSTHYMNNSSTAQTTATAFNEYYPPGTPSTTKTHTTTTTGPIEPIYTTYTDKSDRSNKKAHQFFGEQVKLQVTAKEVRKEGLKALLYSTAPLGYFLYHLLNEYSSENLFFYLAVDNYQNYNFPNHLERQQVANKIAKAYLTRNSELEVNLEDRISRAVKKALLEQQRQPSLSTGNEFDAAKRHVFSLLNVSYHRFRVSSIWDIMEAKCDGHYRDRAQALVVNVLLSFVKRHNNPSLFKLVHSFCRIYLPLGYDARSTVDNIREETKVTNRRSRSKSVGVNSSDKKGNFISSKIDTIFSKTNKTRTK